MERLKLVGDRSWLVSWGPQRELPVSPETIKTDEFIRVNYGSAGILPMTEDGNEVLLGGHLVDGVILYGPFAGNKIPGESVEETALREAKEESGGYEFNNLLPPTVIVHAKADQLGIGVIFPVVIDKNIVFKPNEEIENFKWFSWGGIMGLMDNELDVGMDYEFWGSVYTYALLDLWMKCATSHSWVSDPHGSIPEMMHRIISVEGGIGLGPSYYGQLKNDGKV